MDFAFLIHSRDHTDVQRKFKIAKFLPKSWVEFWCLHWPPVIVSKIKGLKSLKIDFGETRQMCTHITEKAGFFGYFLV
ncbi:MAG: hypothetical protein COY85_04140 [Candidatus Portnoybacteria bacterium CG_4_10_14_0_8_um_filter_40_50]|uniref:Uncharacterized protein n=1 Tax=Candidatus Portnoybacteria bacterium CG_4_10_14_0_8_um_filter_40_50 TaxID=1974800 RepID=A0A2M7QQ16_9BACT|nr:MAG: hypothetical protein COY85_04140 [Candidatus Portnoybacteria bacterium CG_4_10_14_0_8_um_filter_40_50]